MRTSSWRVSAWWGLHFGPQRHMFTFQSWGQRSGKAEAPPVRVTCTGLSWLWLKEAHSERVQNRDGGQQWSGIRELGLWPLPPLRPAAPPPPAAAPSGAVVGSEPLSVLRSAPDSDDTAGIWAPPQCLQAGTSFVQFSPGCWRPGHWEKLCWCRPGSDPL